jgi:hypothetical protein
MIAPEKVLLGPPFRPALPGLFAIGHFRLKGSECLFALGNLFLQSLSSLSIQSLNNGATEYRAIESHRTHKCSRTLLKDY